MLFLANQARVDRFQGLETIDHVAVVIYFLGVLETPWSRKSSQTDQEVSSSE